MLLAGETSGDLLGAELVRAFKRHPRVVSLPFAPRFFGAGGQHMAAEGVELNLDLTAHAVVGLWEVVRRYATFRRLFNQLLALACERQPQVVVLVDFAGFNRRFAHALRRRTQAGNAWFKNWRPTIVQYVSPQVWASRPGRAYALARDLDLLLCLFPFEANWYAERVPNLKVEFVGHPLVDRWRAALPVNQVQPQEDVPLVLLLPGSRLGELKRHLPLMLTVARRIAAQRKVRLRAVLPEARAAGIAREQARAQNVSLEIQTGGLAASLLEASVAVASTGTVTLECALAGLPTVALYRTSWPTYFVARQIVTVKYLAMPNLLADCPIYPELIQGAATPDRIAREVIDQLINLEQRHRVKSVLAEVVQQLGEPGASARAAQAILSILGLR